MTQSTTRAYENRKISTTSQNFKMYADVSALRDLLIDGGLNVACWRILVIGGGSLVVRPVHRKTSDNSADITFPVLAVNTRLDISCSALVSGTATSILVMW